MICTSRWRRVVWLYSCCCFQRISRRQCGARGNNCWDLAFLLHVFFQRRYVHHGCLILCNTRSENCFFQLSFFENPCPISPCATWFLSSCGTVGASPISGRTWPIRGHTVRFFFVLGCCLARKLGALLGGIGCAIIGHGSTWFIAWLRSLNTCFSDFCL